MRSYFLSKTKIKKYLKILVSLLIIFFIIDLSKINYRYVNKNLISFDSNNLSFKLNKKIYYYYDFIFESFLLLNSKHKNFWTIEKDDRYNFEKKNYSIKGSIPESIQSLNYENLLDDWKRSHGNNYSNRFSNLKKINKDNIHKLEVA